jgi:hypothetical protein
MAEYDWAIDLAQELISESGRDMTILRKTPNAPSDPNKPWRTTGATDVEIPVKGVDIPFPADRPEGERRSRDDRAFVIAHTGDLQLTDFIEDSGITYSVQNRVAIKPGNQVICYKVLVRQWPPRSSS